MSSNKFFMGGRRKHSVPIALGTGAVSTITKLAMTIPFKSRLRGINYFIQVDPTGTSLTAEARKLSSDGNTATTLQSAATDINVATDEAAIAASLTATVADRVLTEGQLIEVVFTASAITAGPGDVVIELDLEPLAA